MLFLSIRPKFVSMILSGEKTIELRRRQPRCDVGMGIVLYSTMPECCIKGVAVIKNIVQMEKKTFWKVYGTECGVTHSEYDEYFRGRDSVVGIVLTAVKEFDCHVPLSLLRQKWPSFHPPQQFRYITDAQASTLQVYSSPSKQVA